MPTTAIHSELTRAALNMIFGNVEGFENLINDYSSYPDFYYTERSSEVEKYMYFTDGVQFHYLPDTPYNPLYRYWKMAENKAFLSVPFVNENYRHAKNGFTFYLRETITKLQQNEREEALKYLGCLLHMLEDSTFGLHALEGAHGADAFVLDRLADWGDIQPSRVLAFITLQQPLVQIEYEPRSLGINIAEVVMNLYSCYCQMLADSRKSCFKYVMAYHDERFEECKKLADRMYCNAVKICADVIKTVFDLAQERKVRTAAALRATEIEPYQFPFGGFGAYVFNPVLRNYALDRDGRKMELESAAEKFEYGFSFGSHHAGNLRWDIAPDTFKKFTASLTFHKAYPVDGEITFQIINNGEVIETLTLDAQNSYAELNINAPAGEFGLSFQSTPRTGIMILGAPEFEYI